MNYLQTKSYRSPHPGLADLLQWAAVVDDGIVINKNGSLTAAWLYRGADAMSETDQQQEATSARLNKALAMLNNGWSINIDAVRRVASHYPSPDLSFFPDRVTRAIDEERRRYFEKLGDLYEGYFVLSLTWMPPLAAQRKLVELMFNDDSRKKLSAEESSQVVIEQFKKDITSFEQMMSLAVSMTRLKTWTDTEEDGRKIVFDDLMSWLNMCLTGESQPIRLPANPMYIDQLIGAQDFWTGVTPRLGNKFIQVVNIDGFPQETYPGILNTLAEQACEYRWSTRFIGVDQHEAIAKMDKYRKKWKQKIRGFMAQIMNTQNGQINQDALNMTADAEAGIAEIQSGLVAAGYYTSVVVLMDEDRIKVELAASQIKKAIAKLGFSSRIETINATEAFLGSLPGHTDENIRRPLIHTLNLSDLLPSSTIWAGEEICPCPFYPENSPPLMHCVTSGSTPFRLNLHNGDRGHTIIFGPPGSGKSVKLTTLESQLFRYPGMSLYCFDKGFSGYALTKAAGGLHFNVAGDGSTLAFCPLQYLGTVEDRAWAAEWIETILALNDVKINPVQRNAIVTALSSLHDNGGKTISEFVLQIQDNSIREAMKQYTIEGSMGHLLDAKEDGLSLSHFVTFEIEDLMNLGDKYALPVLLYLFRRIEKSLIGQPAAIVLDEAWMMLGHPAFRAKIREWLKVLRKANCAVIMATQSLSDAANSGILDVIVESCSTKIFLPNPFARDPDTAELYKRMGLNPRQIEIIATALPKRQYYIVSEGGRRLYELALGRLAMAFVAVSDKETISEIRQLESRFGESWVDEYLIRRNLRLADFINEREG
jgi:type IV secretion system protein VirB4